MIEKVLGYLNDHIDRRRDIVEPKNTGNNGEKHLMMLAYYRNNLSHVFAQEAFIALSILSTEGKLSTIDYIWEKVKYLKMLLSEEFIVRDKLKSFEEFKNVVRFMEERNFLHYNKDT
jgi:glycerol-3-phosphate O-acyltransferase